MSDADYAAIKQQIEHRLDAGGPEFKPIEAILVSVGDQTQVAVYRNRKPGDHAHVHSVTKSVLSMLVGIAVDGGKLRLDETLGEALPGYRGQMSVDVAGVTVEQLLTMTAGFPSADVGAVFLENPDLVDQILALGVTTQPGSGFVYSNDGAHVLAAVLAEAVGQTPLEYARSMLFDPLGIQSRPAYEGSDLYAAEFNAAGFAWAADGSGLNAGCCGLRLTAEDMLKLGQLYRAEGRWHGRQLVSADWVRASMAPQVETGDPVVADYGYFWWLAEVDGLRAFVAAGSWIKGSAAQTILVVPDRQLVVVISCADIDQTPGIDQASWDLVWDLVVDPLR